MLGQLWRAIKTILGIVDTAADIVDAGSEIARAVKPPKRAAPAPARVLTPRPPPIPDDCPSPRQITPVPPKPPTGARTIPRPVPLKRR